LFTDSINKKTCLLSLELVTLCSDLKLWTYVYMVLVKFSLVFVFIIISLV